ncbi:MAG: hypothetical protein ILO53_00805 [Clostridia bacterium]|nr:hypothetical protein [Clostridia bacterium]
MAKHFKRIIALILAAFLLPAVAAGLSSCAGQNGEGSGNTGKATAAPSGTGDVSSENGVEVDGSYSFELEAERFADPFNKFTVSYNSSGPVEILIEYKDGDEILSDNYFLEKAEGGIFTGLISRALDGKSGTGLRKLTVKPLPAAGSAGSAGSTGKTVGKVSFALKEITTEAAELPAADKDGNSFIENARYRLGVRLAWGGAVSYIADKNARIDGVENLVNQHDTGRLVQQSFYGTGAIEGVYDPGTFLDLPWNYNPVQGGDRFNTNSRLIDVKTGENQIYVKCQPKDWGNNDLLLPCYYENTYVLLEDRIQVDNRFVDFSGFTHPYFLQELPAFYTVSYLESLVFYNGREPWTGAELTVKSDVSDWTSKDNTGQNHFDLVRGNTESWAAWVNLEHDFGIGVYTPNTDIIHAGRLKFDGSKDSMADPTNYIGLRSELRITSFEPIEYSYLIASGSAREIRDVFTANRTFAHNAGLTLAKKPPEGTGDFYDFTDLDFTKSGSEDLFVNLNNTAVSYDEEEGCVKLTVTTGYDVYCTLSLADNSADDLMAEDYPLLEIEYMIPLSNSNQPWKSELFLSAGVVTGAMAGNSVSTALVCDGMYHTATVRLSKNKVWTGTINQIRFDYFMDCADGDVMYVRAIRLKGAD